MSKRTIECRDFGYPAGCPGSLNASIKKGRGCMTKEEMEEKIATLEAKIRELDDVECIKKLHRDYLFYISNLEFDKALNCFSDNIETQIGVQKGKAEVTRFFRERIYQNVLSSHDAHFTGQAVINVDGDKARGVLDVLSFISTSQIARMGSGKV
jgi:hypothetical protein